MVTNPSDFKSGMLVRNARAPQWGPGKILMITGFTATVYFRDVDESRAGEALKDIDLASALLEILPVQADPLLDNLPPLVDGKFGLTKPRLTPGQAIAAFSRRFPKGFDDPAYLSDERIYKWEAHELWRTTLGDGKGRRLLEQGNVAELTTRALAVDGRLNLLSIYEKAALRDGLKEPHAAERYLRALFDLLEADQLLRGSFESYIDALTRLPAAEGRAPVTRWPVLTLFPFIAHPDRFMFLKPEVTKDCADRFAWGLQYTATLNWTTYDRLQAMCDMLMPQLRPLGARDLIDVQSFIWVIARLK